MRILLGLILLLILTQSMTLHNVKHDLWTLFIIMQLLCYLSIFRVPIPGNAEIVTNDLKFLLEFMWLNPETYIEGFSFG